MTWYADEILLKATAPALKHVRDTVFAPFAYHLRSLDDHAWYEPSIVHALPEEGLLVIRPVCSPTAWGADWHDEEILDASTLSFSPSAEALLCSAATASLSEYLDDGAQLPVALRKATASLAATLGQPVVYYACAMWGGSIDYELSLVYAPDERLVCTECPDRDAPGVEDALRVGLAAIGLELPTGYFAPHTRSFPWARHKLV